MQQSKGAVSALARLDGDPKALSSCCRLPDNELQPSIPNPIMDASICGDPFCREKDTNFLLKVRKVPSILIATKIGLSHWPIRR